MIYKHYTLHILHGEVQSLNTLIVLVILLLVTVVILAFLCFILNRKNTQLTNDLKNKTFNREEDAKSKLAEEIATDYLKILSNTALLESFLPEDDRKLGLRILKKIYDVVYGKKSYPWDKAYKAISLIHNNLPDKLNKLYSELDESEIRICCLTYMEVNNTEIATIMRFKINTIQSKKSVIRKKLGIDGYGNIRDFILDDLNKMK